MYIFIGRISALKYTTFTTFSILFSNTISCEENPETLCSIRCDIILYDDEKQMSTQQRYLVVFVGSKVLSV